MTKIYDAIVLGAGVAGSAAAKLLADRGWHTALVDRHRFPRHKVCGEFLSPESQGTLARLGLLEEVKSLSPSAITRTSMHMRGGGVVSLALPGKALGVSRFLLDEKLHRAAEAAGAEAREGVTVTAVTRQGEHYAVLVRAGDRTEELLARSVIGAWGGAGLSYGERGEEGDTSNDAPKKRKGAPKSSSVGVKMHYRIRSPKAAEAMTEAAARPDAVELYFFRGGYLGLNAVEDGKVNVAALLDRADIPAKHRTVAAMLEEAIRRHPALEARMAGLLPIMGSAAAVSPFRVGLRPVPWNGMPLIGDAICRIPPLCGDGMSMALRSAELCGKFADRYLRGELTVEQWEREYGAAVASEFAGPLRWGRVAHSLLASPVLSYALPLIARLAPGAASGMVRATRLRNPAIVES
ncbi:NAD(P)/FAD-dependent oxidoreductase [Paenibacillus soyae]|uniref:FAD-dependent monooxygenase n=1 Tax=Paenibacillus soyae TaxID=2969249 RepID=A0A9X2SBD8_9BACL|nr:FAD-dependent monooxygenase [Paenibacillus soyae]